MNNAEPASALPKGHVLLPLSYTWGKGIPDLVLHSKPNQHWQLLFSSSLHFCAKEQSNLPFTKGFFSFLMMY